MSDGGTRGQPALSRYNALGARLRSAVPRKVPKMSPRGRLVVALVSTLLVAYVAVGSLLGRVFGDTTYGQLAVFNEVDAAGARRLRRAGQHRPGDDAGARIGTDGRARRRQRVPRRGRAARSTSSRPRRRRRDRRGAHPPILVPDGGGRPRRIARREVRDQRRATSSRRSTDGTRGPSPRPRASASCAASPAPS